MLPVYVISQAVESRMQTPLLLRAEGIPFTLVLDSATQAATAKRMGYKKVAVTNTTDIVAKRNAISAMARGWYIGLDDNIQMFTAVDSTLRSKFSSLPIDDGSNWRPRFNKSVPPALFIAGLCTVADECKKRGTVYGGVATMENPFFRGKRWSYRRFVKTKAFVFDSRSRLEFKHAMCHDSYMTAQTIANYGSVVVDNWMFYKAVWYQKGGLGSREEREARGLLTQLESCCAEFPGLVQLARGKNSALRVTKVTDASVERWRGEHGYLHS